MSSALRRRLQKRCRRQGTRYARSMTRRQRALHEAGHAVAFILEHRRFVKVWLTEFGGGVEYRLLPANTRRWCLLRDIRIGLAGFLSTSLHGRDWSLGDRICSVAEMSISADSRASGDYRSCLALARRALGIRLQPGKSPGELGADAVDRCLEEQKLAALRLLRDHCGIVKTVAARLEEKGELSRAEVCSLVWTAGSGRGR